MLIRYAAGSVPKIVEAVRFLREHDHRLSVFGANGHEYAFRPVAKEAELIEFERQHSLRLPDDYRRFLIEVGNGGAGPFYGVLGFDEIFEATKDSWRDLAKAFPYTSRSPALPTC